MVRNSEGAKTPSDHDFSRGCRNQLGTGAGVADILTWPCSYEPGHGSVFGIFQNLEFQQLFVIRTRELGHSEAAVFKKVGSLISSKHGLRQGFRMGEVGSSAHVQFPQGNSAPWRSTFRGNHSRGFW